MKSATKPRIRFSALASSRKMSRVDLVTSEMNFWIWVSQTLNNWVDGVYDEAYYPWESPKKIRLKSVNPTFASEQKKVSIHQ